MSESYKEQAIERWKLYVSDRADIRREMESAEEKGIDIPENTLERYAVLTDNIHCILERAIEVGWVESEPLEAKVYYLSFPGRVNGEVRRAA